MISVIICSIKEKLSKQIEYNIKQTIGVENEVLIYNNAITNFGICSVYNNQANISKHNILVFVHEDVIFHTRNWGLHLIQYLNEKNTGLLGIAGSIYKTKQAAPWWAVPKHLIKTNIIQHRNGNSIGFHEYQNDNPEINDLAVVDGVFMACRKEVWEEFKFDEVNFPGFHNYDIDFSLSIGQKYSIIFTDKILLEHYSQGSYNISWLNSTKKLHSKWRHYLPISSVQLSHKEKKKIEIEAFANYINLAINRRISGFSFFHMMFTACFIGVNLKFVISSIKTWTKKQFL